MTRDIFPLAVADYVRIIHMEAHARNPFPSGLEALESIIKTFQSCITNDSPEAIAALDELYSAGCHPREAALFILAGAMDEVERRERESK